MTGAADTSASRIEIVHSGPDTSAAETERVLQEAALHRKGGRLALKPLGRFDAPRWVMLRSAVLPGWGQFHNGSWIKGLGVAIGETALGLGIAGDDRELSRLSRAADQAQANGDEPAFEAAVNAYNTRLSGSINRRWFLGGLIAYALVDAYVDAHFAHFNVEFDTGRDAGGSKGTSGKLKLGWSF